MAFYKNDNGTMLIAPNFVYAPTYTLKRTELKNLTLPIDGWDWFNSDEEAYTAYGLEIPVQPEEVLP